MKRKTMSLIFAVLIVVSLAGCDTHTSSHYTDDNGNFVYEYDWGKTVSVSEIPYEVPYNSKHFTLSGVDCYENRTSDYSYNLFVVITLDVGGLSDDEAHWLADKDLDVDVYVTSEKNELDFSSLSRLGQIRWTDEKTIQIVEMSSAFHSYRYSFAESEIVVTVKATQEETYKSESGKYDLHKEEEVTYKTTIASPIPDAERIPNPLYDYVVKWLGKEADFWAR